MHARHQYWTPWEWVCGGSEKASGKIPQRSIRDQHRGIPSRSEKEVLPEVTSYSMSSLNGLSSDIVFDLSMCL